MAVRQLGGPDHPMGRWFAYWESQSGSLRVFGPHALNWAPARLQEYKLLGWWNFPPGTAHREAARELARVGLKLRPPEPE